MDWVDWFQVGNDPGLVLAATVTVPICGIGAAYLVGCNRDGTTVPTYCGGDWHRLVDLLGDRRTQRPHFLSRPSPGGLGPVGDAPPPDTTEDSPDASSESSDGE